MPPKVQTLDELYALNNPLFDPQRAAVRDQMTAASQAGQAEEQALEFKKGQAFKSIDQLASNKGMLFSGFSPDQQAKYTGGTFLPAQAQLRSKVQDNIARLQSALLGLDTEQRKTAMGTREKQEGMLYDYNKEQDRRSFEKEMSEKAYQREMEKLRQTQNFQRSMQPAQVDPAKEFLDHIAQQFKAGGGQGNASVTRQMQDNWANAWFAAKGVMSPDARQYYWDLFNSTYNRNPDASQDWRK